MCIIKYIKKLLKCDYVSVSEFESNKDNVSAALKSLNDRIGAAEIKLKEL